MPVALAKYTFTAVAVGTLCASAFRVGTAPERIRDRLETARQVCLGRGGEWIRVEREYLCAPATAASKG